MALLTLLTIAMASSTVSAQVPSSSSSGNATHGSPQYQNSATQIYLDHLNKTLAWNYLWALLGVIALVFVYTTLLRLNAHVRHLASMSNQGALRCFSKCSPTVSLIKSNILYAPLLHYRRSRELKFSQHVTFGRVPTRFQTIFISLLIITHVFASTWNIPWSDPELEVLPILRNRTGTLGLIAGIALTVILLQSPKVFRALSYEFFHQLHIVLVMLMTIFLWKHLDGLPQRGLLLGFVIFWAAFRTWRFATLLFRSFGTAVSKVKVELLPGGAVKLNISSPRPWKYRPGQSLYLTIPSIGLWTAHPFSVAWSGVEQPLSRNDSIKTVKEKAPVVSSRVVEMIETQGEQTMSLIVKKHRGLTRKLWERAEKASSPLTLNAYIEGPYGTERSLSSYGTVMLFASGVGITHQLPYVKALVEGFSQGTVAVKRMTLVWVIPTTECLDWVRPWMHEILGMEGRREVLRVLLYVTRAGLSQSIRSPSEMVRMSRGRPDVQSLMWNEMEQKIGCLGVSVCAGGGLADEVRRVSRLMLDRGANLDLIEEGFGW
ncbi:hypothetical protein LTR06_002441 [Exophiala xenobiotica]|nr:hypothetical protein LTR06_002441 [Exophiala xenobiotica]